MLKLVFWVYNGVWIMCVYLRIRIQTRVIGGILGIIRVYVRFKVIGARATGGEDP